MIFTALAILLGLLALSVPVAAALGVLGLSLSQLYSPLPLSFAMGEVAWSGSTSFILVAVPFFVMLGEIMLRAGIAERMYGAMLQWVSWLPGGLMHSNIGACAMFAATSGSSPATAATIGTVAVGEITKYEYNERLFLGTLAAGGTLGILIPPSINLIIYGVLTETSIPQLYLAGFIPGFVLAGLFMMTVLAACSFRRPWGGKPVQSDWQGRLRGLPDLVPPILLFILVIGSIYAGFATPTESAALGVIGALVLAAWRRRLGLSMLRQVLEGTMTTTAMIMAIVIAALFLNVVFTGVGLTRQVNNLILELGLSPFQTLLIVIGFYLVLGMFMETLSMMLATVPIITPIIVNLGYDPVWFGVLIVLLIETAMITPPVGINLFVVHGIRSGGQLHDVMLGAAPFVLTLVVMIVLLVMFPDIALWLPRLFGQR
jgi:tripartite ATP-independent transporter DctM subunit